MFLWISVVLLLDMFLIMLIWLDSSVLVWIDYLGRNW